MAEKIVLIEYIGKVWDTKIMHSLDGEIIEFKPNPEWGGRKVAAVDPATAAEWLRFPTVFREVDVRELVKTVKGNVSIDWTVRENVRAKLRVMVKRVLRKHGYPPDKQEKATQTVLEQAEVLSEEWAEAN